jgi:hypothetical protein
MEAVAYVGNSLSHEHRNRNFFTKPLQISIKFGKDVGLMDIRVSDKLQIVNPSILFVTGTQISQKKVTFWCNKACKTCYKSNPKCVRTLTLSSFQN